MAALFLGRSCLYTLNNRLGGLQLRFEYFGEEKYVLILPGIDLEVCCCRASRTVSTLTELSGLILCILYNRGNVWDITDCSTFVGQSVADRHTQL